jgi:hypothetical protein
MPMRTPSRSARCAIHVLTLIMAVAATTAAGAVCACTGMNVSHADRAQVKICSNANLNFRECARAAGANSGCVGHLYSYTCPVGVNSTVNTRNTASQKTGFGIEATLMGNSDECHSGHALQETITSDHGVTIPMVHATPQGDVTIGNFHVTIRNDRGSTFPPVGEMTRAPNRHPLFGADSYTDPAAADVLIERTEDQNGGHIKWWDNPDQTKDAPAENATWHFRYFSYVTGSTAADGCGCVFNINVTWLPNQAAITSWAFDAASSRRCGF